MSATEVAARWVAWRATAVPRPDTMALGLRLGLGAVFVIGGYNKLAQLIDPATQGAILGRYLGPLGYINGFFSELLFQGPLGSVITPWGFLTTLSTFELVGGVALIVGLAVRPLALVYGFLLWSFVMALPVATAPGIVAPDTYTSPALLVQARDVALSGLMFVLFNLGAGARSLDGWLIGAGATAKTANWDNLGLLARFSLAAPLLIGGMFAGLDHIHTFQAPAVLLVGLGAAVLGGMQVRVAALGVAFVMLAFAAQSVDFDRSLIANLNGVKREFALFAAAAVLARFGGGAKFTLGDLAGRARGLARAYRARRAGSR